MPDAQHRTTRAVRSATRHLALPGRARSQLLAVMAAATALALAACGNSGTSSTTTSPKTFGVNATGTVHFWARQATDGPAKALVAGFNATHKNLKVLLH